MALLFSLFFSEAERRQRVFLQYQSVTSGRFFCDDLSIKKEKVL